MRVAVSEKKENLEAEHAGSPDSGTTAKHWQNVFALDQLDLEKEEGAEEHGESVEGKARFGRRVVAGNRTAGSGSSRGSRFGFSKYRRFGHAAFLQDCLRPSNRKLCGEA
jgi:hypothetical protein